MKIHLMIMTAALSFCIAHNCEAQDTKGKAGDTCETADECASKVCIDQKCAEKKNKGADCEEPKECKSYVCTDGKCAQGIVPRRGCVVNPEQCASGEGDDNDTSCISKYPEIPNVCK
jgi:hypothetical protein